MNKYKLSLWFPGYLSSDPKIAALNFSKNMPFENNADYRRSEIKLSAGYNATGTQKARTWK